MIYDPEANVLCWELSNAPISHAREFGDFIIHLSKAGKPVLIEILNASSFTGQFKKLDDKMVAKLFPSET